MKGRVERGVGCGLVTVLALFPGVASGQGFGPAVVRYAEARTHAVQRLVELQGSVEARTSSLVASEIEGRVMELAVREGQGVKSGQVLARLRTDELELRLQAAKAQLTEAEARLKQAEQSLRRSNELWAEELIPRQQLDDATQEVDAWRGRTAQLEAEIARTKLDLERSTVTAPFAGVVVAERTEVGEWLGRGDPVVELISQGDLEVRVEVPEQYYRAIARGSQTTVRFDSVPGLEIEGRVSRVVPRANPQARTFPFIVRIPNEKGRVGAGMLARVGFVAGDAVPSTIVPKDAVVNRSGQRFVYLVKDDGTVDMAPVTTGASAGAWIAVEGPVAPGAKVVTRGNERLMPGQPVQGEPMEYEIP